MKVKSISIKILLKPKIKLSAKKTPSETAYFWAKWISQKQPKISLFLGCFIFKKILASFPNQPNWQNIAQSGHSVFKCQYDKTSTLTSALRILATAATRKIIQKVLPSVILAQQSLPLLGLHPDLSTETLDQVESV